MGGHGDGASFRFRGFVEYKVIFVLVFFAFVFFFFFVVVIIVVRRWETFRSKESIDLLKQADIVVTNPPFSLFREYVAQLFEYKKQFLIIGHQNAITYKEIFPDQRVAVASVAHFAEDFIRALAEGVAGAWRERWWTVDLLLVHGIQHLSETERAQDEFFHLFEALKRRGARMMLVANRSPSNVESIDDRLRSRFEGGLVLELAGGEPADLELVEQTTAEADDGIFVPDMESEAAKGPETRTMEPVPSALSEAPSKGGAWFPGPENVVIHWPRIEELLIEELD